MTPLLIGITTLLLLALVGIAFVVRGILFILEDMEPTSASDVGRQSSFVSGTDGLLKGSMAPMWTGKTLSGKPIESAFYTGSAYIVAFAEPGCGPCEALMGDVLSMPEWALPFLLVISAGTANEYSSVWWNAARRPDVEVVVDQQHAVSSLFETRSTPHIFVISETGHVAFHGITNSLTGLGELVRSADAQEEEIV